jgi:hypothetical protein
LEGGAQKAYHIWLAHILGGLLPCPTLHFSPLTLFSRLPLALNPTSSTPATTTPAISPASRPDALSERLDASRNAIQSSNECDNFSRDLFPRVVEFFWASPALRRGRRPKTTQDRPANELDCALPTPRHFRKFATRELRHPEASHALDSRPSW